MKEFFEIVTLHDCAGCNNKRKIKMRDGNSWYASLPVIGQIIDILFSGGRSPQQIQADEIASANFHYAIAQNPNHPSNPGKHVYPLTIDQVGAILRPGWNAGENGTQLANRFINALISIDNGVSYYNETGKMPSQAGIFGDIGIVPLLIVGGLAYMFLSSPSKKRKTA